MSDDDIHYKRVKTEQHSTDPILKDNENENKREYPTLQPGSTDAENVAVNSQLPSMSHDDFRSRTFEAELAMEHYFTDPILKEHVLSVSCNDKLMREKLKYSILRPAFTDAENLAANSQLPSIHSLNEDCLYVMFTYFNFVELTKLSAVCRRWYNLCTEKLGRTTILKIGKIDSDVDFESKRYRIPFDLAKNVKGFVSVLARTKNSLLRLDLTDLHFERTPHYNGTLNVIRYLCPKLERLDLPDDSTFINELSLDFSHLIAPNLKYFDAMYMINEVQLEVILKNCKNLEHLSLEDNGDITGVSIACHLRNNKMRSLCLDSCDKIKPFVMQFIFEQYSESLEKLSIAGPYVDILSLSTDKIQPLKCLTQFNIGSNSFIYLDIFGDNAPYSNSNTEYTKTFIRLLKLMPNLTDLCIAENSLLDWSCECMSLLPSYCPQLVSLTAPDCQIQSFEYLLFVSGFSKLRFLNIGNHGIISGFSAFVKNTVLKLERLERLDVWSDGFQISVLDILTLIQNLSHLDDLSISSCTPTTMSEEDFSRQILLVKDRAMELRIHVKMHYVWPIIKHLKRLAEIPNIILDLK